tara:strand:+ start:10203 stop:10331 length:129 start_codon:yes stop_codon:yes gene_type:complete
MTKFRIVDRQANTLGYVMAETEWHARALGFGLWSQTFKAIKQ